MIYANREDYRHITNDDNHSGDHKMPKLSTRHHKRSVVHRMNGGKGTRIESQNGDSIAKTFRLTLSKSQTIPASSGQPGRAAYNTRADILRGGPSKTLKPASHLTMASHKI